MRQTLDVQQPAVWRVTNDNVMGGFSCGHLELTADHVRFSGELSTKNNGGFSSAYCAVSPVDAKMNCVTLFVCGDGRTYQFRLVCERYGQRVFYKHEFATQKERQQFVLPFQGFHATWRGRELANAPRLKAEDITEVGVLISSKRPLSFALEIFAIDFAVLPIKTLMCNN